MIIKKDIILAELSVDIDNGILWLNEFNCVLRISGLKFDKIIEKFSMLDIKDSKVYMLEDNLPEHKIKDFVKRLITIIISNDYTDEDMVKILKKISDFKKED